MSTLKGGARDQTTTQYCAEAMEAHAKIARLEAKLRTADEMEKAFKAILDHPDVWEIGWKLNNDGLQALEAYRKYKKL